MAMQQSLRPPSFFQHRSPAGEQRQTPGSEALNSPTSKQLQDLRRQNDALREELEVYQKLTSRAGSSGVLESPQFHPTLLTPAGARIPHLTSDLLQVEECLQSKVKLLDSEKKEACLKVLQLEKELLEQSKMFTEEKDNLLREHRVMVGKLQRQLLDLTVDYEKHRSNMASQVEQLEARLQQAHQQKVVHVQELEDKVTQLEHNYHELQVKRDAEVEQLSIELTDKKRQLELIEEDSARKIAECQNTISLQKEELQSSARKVEELEAYLGGEIPDLASGKTWVEERQLQACHVEKVERENRKLISESKLLNIRLDSISEILSIQEQEVTKKCGQDREAYQTLLSRWRNKVFALLVQQKLQDIEVAREVHELRNREEVLKEEVEKCARKCQVLSGSLADKDAQLQMGTLQTKEVQEALENSERSVHQLELRLQAEQTCHQQIKKKFESFVQISSIFKSLLHRSLTQLVNYDQRIALLSGHVKSVTASIDCRRITSAAAVQDRVSDVGCEENAEQPEVPVVGVVSLTRDQLEHEMNTLRLERDQLVKQLQDCSKSFREQIDKEMLEKKHLKEQLKYLEQQCSSLTSSLDNLHSEIEANKADNQENIDKISLLEDNLRQVEAKAEAKLEQELSACRDRSRAELREMEKLLTVARREHSKAVMDVQQLTRQLARDQDLVKQAAHVDSQQLQQELASTQKKLQAVLAEKNLILATLRDGGTSVPLKPHTLRPSQRPPSLRGNVGSSESIHGTVPAEVSGTHSNGCDEGEDIRDVLKDLQMLSASLLNMEKEQNTLEPPNK